ncbi:mannitol dehydrogenase family protein [Neotamlana laminarinivorans]|uniref:Mannitol dehydrogenase family protein n=1 Tax=Neotamlana laminarinivorans TaxID=2883124 RepID=A0A9X1HZJ9_9FLAO|nr:mannitol dehydrogenase family protein [Tamlana laminarinivorans]MCB4799043.1 mannitol dehydrogenase family protein [Tamlana laminarinivorans]
MTEHKIEHKLNTNSLTEIANRVAVPSYNRVEVEAGIVHVGIGGFHRAHEALYTDELLNDNSQKKWGICGVALLEFDKKIHQTLTNQNGLYTLIVKELDGTLTNRVIGSIVDFMYAPENPWAVVEKMASPETKIITLTITEGGYNFNEATGEFIIDNPSIQYDLKNPTTPKTIFGYLTESLKLRKENNIQGVTIQSCDNIQGNGHVTKKMLLSYMQHAEPELIPWVEANVSFPNSMVDRITPATVASDIITLKETTGIMDEWPVVCEPFKQWVIEDEFVAGRPAWENAGAQFVTDVVPYEKMKLTLLNAGHSVLGILGALLGYKTIDEAVHDENLSAFLKTYMNLEVTPTLGNLKGVNLEEYKQTLIERFGNTHIKDQVERICSESSAKIPKFILPTVTQQLKNSGQVELAAYVLAAWAIYSLGENEKGEKLIIRDAMEGLLYEKAMLAKTDPKQFLEIDSIFGDLKSSENFVSIFEKAYSNIAQFGIKKGIFEINQKYK